MRFYSSFTALVGDAMRNEITLKALEESARLGDVVLLTSAGFNHVLGTPERVPVEVTWTGVEGVKTKFSDSDEYGLVDITILPPLLKDRWLRFKSMLLKLETKGKMICSVNQEHQAWYIHTIVSHGHQYMTSYTVGWDGSIVPDVQGECPSEVLVNLAHLIELTPKEQSAALAAVHHDVN